MHVVNVLLNGTSLFTSPQFPELDAAAAWRRDLGNRLIAEGWRYRELDTVMFIRGTRHVIDENFDDGTRGLTLTIVQEEPVAHTPNEALARIAAHLVRAA